MGLDMELVWSITPVTDNIWWVNSRALKPITLHLVELEPLLKHIPGNDSISLTAAQLLVEDWSNIVAVPGCHKSEGYRLTLTIENKVLQGNSSNFSAEAQFERNKEINWWTMDSMHFSWNREMENWRFEERWI